MPPKARGGRGRGRGSRGRGRGGRTTPAGRDLDFSDPASENVRKRDRVPSRRSAQINGNSGSSRAHTGEVYAIWEKPLLIIAGLTEEDFDRWNDESDQIEQPFEAWLDQWERAAGGREQFIRSVQRSVARRSSSSSAQDEVPDNDIEGKWVQPPSRGFYKPPMLYQPRKKTADDEHSRNSNPFMPSSKRENSALRNENGHQGADEDPFDTDHSGMIDETNGLADGSYRYLSQEPPRTDIALKRGSRRGRRAKEQTSNRETWQQSRAQPYESDMSGDDDPPSAKQAAVRQGKAVGSTKRRSSASGKATERSNGLPSTDIPKKQRGVANTKGRVPQPEDSDNESSRSRQQLGLDDHSDAEDDPSQVSHSKPNQSPNLLRLPKLSELSPTQILGTSWSDQSSVSCYWARNDEEYGHLYRSPPAEADDDQAGSRESHSKRGIEPELESEPEPEPISAPPPQPDIPEITMTIEEDSAEDESDLPEMINEGELSDFELPPPFLDRLPTPDMADCEDEADFLLRTRFLPMGDSQALIAALTKHPVEQRSSEVLFQLAMNAQNALKVWQDEYIILDARTAPQSMPAKKPVTGGRVPMSRDLYEDMKEATLYGYTYDHKKAVGTQNPFSQRPGGKEFNETRELRRRGKSVERNGSDDEGHMTEPGKRIRRAVQKYQGIPMTLAKGTKRAPSVMSEREGTPRKRGRPAIHRNLSHLRETSVMTSTGSEDGATPEPMGRRRGRPPGSKNHAPRSDAGVKKGPRGPRRKHLLSEAFVEETDETADSAADRLPSPKTQKEFVDRVADEQGLAPEARQLLYELAPIAGLGHLPRGDIPNGPLPSWIPDHRVKEPRASTDRSSTDKAGVDKRKQKVKSEKRSQSMTEWWAARKAKAREDRQKQEAERAAQQETAALQHSQQQTSSSSGSGATYSRGHAGKQISNLPSPAPIIPDQQQHHQAHRTQAAAYDSASKSSYPTLYQPPPTSSVPQGQGTQLYTLPAQPLSFQVSDNSRRRYEYENATGERLADRGGVPSWSELHQGGALGRDAPQKPQPESREQRDKDWIYPNLRPTPRGQRDKDWIRPNLLPTRREERDKDWVQPNLLIPVEERDKDWIHPNPLPTPREQRDKDRVHPNLLIPVEQRDKDWINPNLLPTPRIGLVQPLPGTVIDAPNANKRRKKKKSSLIEPIPPPVIASKPPTPGFQQATDRILVDPIQFKPTANGPGSEFTPVTATMPDGEIVHILPANYPIPDVQEYDENGNLVRYERRANNVIRRWFSPIVPPKQQLPLPPFVRPSEPTEKPRKRRKKGEAPTPLQPAIPLAQTLASPVGHNLAPPQYAHMQPRNSGPTPASPVQFSYDPAQHRISQSAPSWPPQQPYQNVAFVPPSSQHQGQREKPKAAHKRQKSSVNRSIGGSGASTPVSIGSGDGPAQKATKAKEQQRPLASATPVVVE